MLRRLLFSKIHRATVTEANIDYVGSLSVDEELIEEAGLSVYEEVLVSNVTNGERLTTYIIAAPRGSRAIGANGAAAHKIGVGDLIIIFGFAYFTDAERISHHPSLVFVDRFNNPVPGPAVERHSEVF